jgi:hypothetical protein
MSTRRGTNLALAALLVALVFSQAASAQWLHYTNGVTQASSAKQKHRGALTMWSVVPTDVANPTICAVYESNHPKQNRGRIESTARIDRADGSSERLQFSGRVRENLSFECQPAAEPIAADDLVTFDFDFKGLPKQRLSQSRADFFSVNGIVSNLGAPGPRAIPPGVNPPPLGGEVHAAISMYAAERNRQRHPKTLTQSVVMGSDAASPVICSALGNIAERANKGRVVTAVTVMHQDGSETSLSFNGRVVNNIYSECQIGPSLVAGDIVRFEYLFKRLPKLRVEGGFFDVAATYGIVSPDGIPMIRGSL